MKYIAILLTLILPLLAEEPSVFDQPFEEAASITLTDTPEPENSPIAQEIIEAAAQEEELSQEIAEAEIASVEEEVAATSAPTEGVLIDFAQVFKGSPSIYTLLVFLSIGSFSLALYSMLSVRTKEILPDALLSQLRDQLLAKDYAAAERACKESNSLTAKMVGAALSVRAHGVSAVQESVKAEGRRATASLWQRTSLLSDIGLLAPMIGLLGTVVGMFYAFYDLNRSMESLSALFDGLGISVGTTVCGLLVAILAMILHSITKFRLIRQLTFVEKEVEGLCSLITSPGRESRSVFEVGCSESLGTLTQEVTV